MSESVIRKNLLAADATQRELAFRQMRHALKMDLSVPVGFVHAVAWIKRTDDLEFAALEYRTEAEYMEILEWVTQPNHPFTVTRETASRVFITVR